MAAPHPPERPEGPGSSDLPAPRAVERSGVADEQVLSPMRERGRNVLVYFGLAEERPSALLPGADPPSAPTPLDAKGAVVSFVLYGFPLGVLTLATGDGPGQAAFKGVLFGVFMTLFQWFDTRRRVADHERAAATQSQPPESTPPTSPGA